MKTGLLVVIALLSNFVVPEVVKLKCIDSPWFRENFEKSSKEYCSPTACLYESVVITGNSTVDASEMHSSCAAFSNSSMSSVPPEVLRYYYGVYAANASISKLEDNMKWPSSYLNVSYNAIEKVMAPIGTYTTDFSHNQISNFSGVGEKRSNYYALNMSYNQIKSLPMDSFTKTYFKSINFNNNLISELIFSPSSYSSGKVDDLDLSNNLLKELPADFFRRIHVENLKLSNNSFENLKFVTEEASYLIHLDLAENEIKNLDDLENFSASNNLNSLIVSNNYIENFSLNHLRKLKNLKVFKLNGNKLQSIGTAPITVAIDVLDLSYNSLTKLSFKLFESIIASSLDLSHNKITHFEDYRENFLKWKKQGSVDLSHNLIHTLSMNAVSKITADSLILSHNKIHQFNEYQTVNNIPRLDISYNHLSNIPYGLLLESKIKNLTLAGNKINVDFGIFPADIEILDLRNNKLKIDAVWKFFEFYDNLESLDLSGNLIDSKYGTFRGQGEVPTLPVNLKRFGMRDVKMSCYQLKEILRFLRKNKVDYIRPTGVKFGIKTINGLECQS